MNEIELICVRNYVLKDISIGIRREKITAIIGRSGSGKSTLVKTINGLVKPTRGKVIVSGLPLDYENILPHRRKIGYVVQGNGLFPHLTVHENISLPGKISNQTGDVSKLLSFVNLPEEYGKKYPWQLSGGEQQRVAICRALFLNPPILLMDEPFASLDTYTREDLHKKILDLREKFNLTIVIVTHDIPEANKLADDIITLDHGRFV